jgi:hypothetical protein
VLSGWGNKQEAGEGIKRDDPKGQIHELLLLFLANLVFIVTAEVVHSISHLLPTHHGHIQQVIRGQDNLQATRRGVIGVKYLVTFPEERT